MYRGLVYLLHTYLLTPCNRVLLEKLSGSQPVKKFPAFYHFMEFEGSLLHSQEPATCPYPQPHYPVHANSLPEN